MFLVYIFPMDKALAASPGIGWALEKENIIQWSVAATLPDIDIRVVIPHSRNFDNIYTSYQIFMILLG